MCRRVALLAAPARQQQQQQQHVHGSSFLLPLQRQQRLSMASPSRGVACAAEADKAAPGDFVEVSRVGV